VTLQLQLLLNHKDLALLLNSGALPAPVHLLEESYIPSPVDPFTGTWVLNLSKSTIPQEVYTPNSLTAHMVLKGPAIEATMELHYESGVKENIQSKAKFDGKDYPITVEPGHPEASFTAAYERVDNNTIKATLKRDGHVLVTETIVLSPDGRNLTESIIIALKEWTRLRKVHALTERVRRRPLSFTKGFSARRVRSTNRRP